MRFSSGFTRRNKPVIAQRFQNAHNFRAKISDRHFQTLSAVRPWTTRGFAPNPLGAKPGRPPFIYRLAQWHSHSCNES